MDAVLDFESVSGLGSRGRVGESRIVIGSRKFIESEGTNVDTWRKAPEFGRIGENVRVCSKGWKAGRDHRACRY